MSSSVKIVHVITGLGVGGAENMLLKTLPLITDVDHHIISLTNENALRQKFLDAHIPVTTINFKEGFFSGVKRLKNEISHIQPNIIVSYLIHANILTRILVKLYFRRTTNISSIRSFYRGGQQYLFAIDILTSPLTDHYIAVSRSLKRNYMRFGVPGRKITVIPNGIDFNAMESRTAEPKDPVLICVARFHPKKDHETLLRAFSKLKSKSSLLLIGDGPLRGQLERLVQNLGIQHRVKFLGERNDVPSLLRSATAFVLPTKYEGMSNALLEAAAAGLPIITTDIPENRDILPSDDAAVFVPVGDIPALCHAMESVLSDAQRRDSLSRKARESVQKFSLNATARALSDFFWSWV